MFITKTFKMQASMKGMLFNIAMRHFSTKKQKQFRGNKVNCFDQLDMDNQPVHIFINTYLTLNRFFFSFFLGKCQFTNYYCNNSNIAPD